MKQNHAHLKRWNVIKCGTAFNTQIGSSIVTASVKQTACVKYASKKNIQGGY